MGTFLKTSCWLLPLKLLAITTFPATVHANTDANAAHHQLDLVPRADNNNNNTTPAPLAIRASEAWDGIDGEWSSFWLRVGTPAKYARTLVSTASCQTWVVLDVGCKSARSQTACSESRGGVFSNLTSSTWTYVGIYALNTALTLDYDGNAVFGYDTVGLGMEGEGGPTLLNTTVGMMAADDFWLGMFGVNPKPTNWTNFDDGAPSYMTLLKEQNLIPSVSFGYTAGAKYRYTGVLASLTLGGYDTSKFIENNVTFVFAADNERDLMVAIQSIQTPSNVSSSPVATELLPSPIYAYIDSSVPDIWLPIEACQVFEYEFGLVYDNVHQMYIVNDTLHDTLVERNASVTFHLGQGSSGGQVVQITLPYASFDLTAKPPYKRLANNTRYFPLQRAQNSTQYTLGRTFLQEAYISVDWQSARFNVSQVSWDQTPQQNLVPILPNVNNSRPDSSSASASSSSSNSSGSSGTSSSLPTGAIAGVAVGAGVVALLIGALLLFWARRKKRAAAARRIANEKLQDDSNSGTMRRSNSGYQKAELEGSSAADVEDRRLLSAHGTMPGTPTSMVPPSSPGYFMSVASASNPSSPGAGEGTHSSTQSGAIFSPISASLSEADSRERQVYEMPGDMPIIREKDGKALSEKEALQYREQIYNGITSSTPTTSVHQNESIRGPRRVNPDEIVDTGKSAEDHDEGPHKRFSYEDGTGEQELYD